MQIVSARSWRGMRARGGTFCTESAHRDTGRDQASNLAMSGVAGTSDPQKHPAASRPSSWRSQPQPSGPTTAKVAAGLSGNRRETRQSRRRSQGSSAG